MNTARPLSIVLTAALLTGCLGRATTPALAQLLETPDETISWVEEKGDHFIIYSQYETSQVRDIMRKAERHYDSIAERLKFPRHSEFWLWDDRVNIYLYEDKETYLEKTGEPDWSLGMANYTARSIYGYLSSPRFLTSILPHEIAHLIFRDFYQKENAYAIPPSWLDEGVAQWAENKETKDELKKLAADLFKKEGLLPLADMILLNLKYVKTNTDRLHFRLTRTINGKYTIVIFSPDVLLNSFYIEAGSLVGYLIETFGAQRFAELCRELSRERAVSNALRAAYPRQFRSLSDLENGWRAYLLED